MSVEDVSGGCWRWILAVMAVVDIDLLGILSLVVG